MLTALLVLGVVMLIIGVVAVIALVLTGESRKRDRWNSGRRRELRSSQT
jgi:FtsZ-interacting cell division protein ZipA